MKQMRCITLLAAAVLAAVPAVAQPPQGPPKPQDFVNADLFIAIRNNDMAAVKAALAKKADPNSRNWLDITPLMWASMTGNQQIVDLLLKSGAQLDAPSNYGSAFTMATMGGHTQLAQVLLARGASVAPKRGDSITPLMLAAQNGDLAILRELLAHKALVDDKDNDGCTALLHAARFGRVEAAAALLAAGAKIDTADAEGWTALHYAAANGHAKLATALLNRGAKVDGKDKAGRTPLMLAARYSGDPALVGALTSRHATVDAADAEGNTPSDYAAERGFAACAAMLKSLGARPAKPLPARQPQDAVKLSLAALQGSMSKFSKVAPCASCHHQGLGLMVLGQARRAGYAVDAALIEAQAKLLTAEADQAKMPLSMLPQHPEIAKLVPATDMHEFSVGASFMFCGLLENKPEADESLTLMTRFLAQQQAEDGKWFFIFHREPIQSSQFAPTALTLRLLNAWLPKDEAAPRIDRAKHWLLTEPAKTTDDLAYRVLGLKWAGASSDEMAKAVAELRAAQRADGGWGQRADMRTDGYATGLASYALAAGAGLSKSDGSLKKGLDWLLRNQDDDGAWYVSKRAVPANTYFDTGFPGGQSQYISFGATCWATMALVATSDNPRTAAR